MARSLNVWINQARLGVLSERNGLWAFAYSSDWLSSPEAHPLCPDLPLRAEEHLDGATRRPVQWYFDNLLPEEGQRQLVARAANSAVEDAFALLAYFGAESAGSITLLPADEAPPEGGVQPLPDAELSRRIRQMPQIPLAERSAKKMSLAGAQHKVAVIYRDGRILEPTGSTPSTHILKPDHPGEAWPHSVINEWFVMNLAARMGLSVPPVHRLYVPEPVYLIERFDRYPSQAGWARRHCIDACQLLGLAREFKYSAGSLARLADISARCLPPAKARLSLFQWLVFNVLVGNEDAHLKNLSFLPGATSLQLAPFYDLLCTAVYGTRAFDQDRWPQQASLAWPINGVERLVDIDQQVLVEAGRSLGIKPATARTLIARLAREARQQARLLLTEVEQQNETLARSRPEIRATLAGETRLLRAVEGIVIAEMGRQLEG